MADNTDSGSQDQDNHSKAKRRKTSIGDTEDERFPEMKHFMNESKSDVVFIIDGQRVPAIKAVLGLKSDVFDAMFSGQYSESTAKEIQITHTTAAAFVTLVLFMYTQRLFLTDASDLKLIGDVVHCADYYRVIPLVDAIGQHLETMITIETVDEIAELADKYRIRGLRETIGTRLAALLTVENVLFVARVGYGNSGPTDEFVSALKAFLVFNYQQVLAKENQFSIDLNAITNNVWLEVMLEEARRPPLRYIMRWPGYVFGPNDPFIHYISEFPN